MQRYSKRMSVLLVCLMLSLLTACQSYPAKAVLLCVPDGEQISAEFAQRLLPLYEAGVLYCE